jgi:hypothetical protein
MKTENLFTKPFGIYSFEIEIHNNVFYFYIVGCFKTDSFWGCSSCKDRAYINYLHGIKSRTSLSIFSTKEKLNLVEKL